MFQIRHFSIRTFLSVCDCFVAKVMKTWHHHKKESSYFKREKWGNKNICALRQRNILSFHNKISQQNFLWYCNRSIYFCIDYKMVREKRIFVLFRESTLRTERCHLRALSKVSPRICVKQQNLGIKLFLICHMNCIVPSSLLNSFM